MKMVFAAMVAISSAGCATRYLEVPFPTYEYVGIDLGATATGVIELEGKCLVMYRDIDLPARDPVQLVLPLGTRLTGNAITLPVENGGGTVRLGARATFQGGYAPLEGEVSRSRNPGGCSGSAFTVNRLYGPLPD